MIPQNPCRDIALNYAHNLKWSVIPIGSDKKPLESWTAYQTTRATAAQIRKWFDDYPGMNIGIATGPVSGFFVLDCDDQAAIDRVVSSGLPNTFQVKTSRGAHFYFSLPDFPVRNTTDLFGGNSQIDIRGEGGYVVAAPSLHPSGKRYEMVSDDADLEPAPGWLLDLLRPKVKTKKPSTAAPDLDIALIKQAAFNPSYIEAAVNAEVEAVRSAPEGTRNDTLNGSTFNLATLVGANAISAAAVSDLMLDAARQAGLDEREAVRTIGSALRAGQEKPRTVPALNKNQRIKQATRRTESKTISSSLVNPTDLGDAQRLVEWEGESFRYIPPMNKFLVWDGTRFAADEVLGIYRLVQRLPKRLYSEASYIDDPSERQKAVQHAIRCESASKMDAILRIAKTHQKIAVLPNELDADPWLLNARNCTIDLHTGQVREQRRDDLITRRIEVSYEQRAKCPTWLAFLDRVTDHDEELAAFLQRAVGYSLTGQVTEQCLFFLFGTGRNGKTTFLETLLKLIGEYAINTPTETLMARDRTAATNDLARLAGRRLVVANETNEGQRLDEAKVKALTGGNSITARYLYGEFFDFNPTHKLWLAGNHKPQVRGMDKAIWRRIKPIPFTVEIPSSEVDPLLPDKLAAELPGILNWAIAGCLDWQQNGLGDTERVRAAAAEYQSEMDILRTFIEDELLQTPGQTAAQEIYDRYTTWATRNGEREMSQTKLGKLLKERGFVQTRTTAQRFWTGIRLRSHQTP